MSARSTARSVTDYFNHSGMTGFLQTAFYFLYMAVVAFAFFLMMGAIGFFSAFSFVRYIYRRGSCDCRWSKFNTSSYLAARLKPTSPELPYIVALFVQQCVP